MVAALARLNVVERLCPFMGFSCLSPLVKLAPRKGAKTLVSPFNVQSTLNGLASHGWGGCAKSVWGILSLSSNSEG